MNVGDLQPQCGFKSTLNDTLCPSLQKQPGAATAEACRAIACSNTSVQAWQWCPDPGTGAGCERWEGTRCWVGGSASSPALNCTSASRWVGQSRAAPKPRPAPSSAKRGFSGFLGGPARSTCGDAEALGLAQSWFYTWTHEPAPQGLECAAGTQAREFVPMINGLKAGSNVGDFQKVWADSNAHYILGYNEPDYGNGHNHPHMCSPQQAAENWPVL